MELDQATQEKIEAQQEGLFFLGYAKEFSSKKPVKKLVNGLPILVVKSGESVRAYEDFCPHRGYPLSGKKCVTSKNGEPVLKCAYHGWEFGLEGDLKYRPGYQDPILPKVSLKSVPIVTSGDFVFVKFGTDHEALPKWAADLADSEFNSFRFAKSVSSKPGFIAENLLDPFHTHYVHAGLQRSDSKRFPVDVKIKYTSSTNSIETIYTNEPRPLGIISRIFERDRAKGLGTYYHPGVVVLEYWSSKRLELRITVMVTPQEKDQCQGTVVFQLSKKEIIPYWIKLPLFFFFSRLHLIQDVVVLKEQHKNLKHFQDRRFFLSTEDVVYRTITALYQGKKLEDFERTYKINI